MMADAGIMGYLQGLINQLNDRPTVKISAWRLMFTGRARWWFAGPGLVLLTSQLMVRRWSKLTVKCLDSVAEEDGRSRDGVGTRTIDRIRIPYENELLTKGLSR